MASGQNIGFFLPSSNLSLQAHSATAPQPLEQFPAAPVGGRPSRSAAPHLPADPGNRPDERTALRLAPSGGTPGAG